MWVKVIKRFIYFKKKHWVVVALFFHVHCLLSHFASLSACTEATLRANGLGYSVLQIPD